MALPTTDRFKNWSQLVSVVQGALEDEGEDLSKLIPTAIALAEERLTKELDTLGVRAVTTISVATGERFISKPTRYRLAYDISYPSTNGTQKYLTKVNNDFVDLYWPVRTSTGNPKYYADQDDDKWVIAAPVSSSVAFEVSYVEKPAPLSAGASVNYYVSSTPDCLFYATMVKMAEFAKQWNQIEVWEREYQVALQALNNEARRSRRDDNTDPRNPDIGQNTLMRTN